MTAVPPESLEAMGVAIRDARHLDFASAIGNLVKSVLLFYSAPEHQAFLAGAFLGAAASHRLRTGPSVIVSFIAGLAAEKAYLTMRNVNLSLEEIAAIGRAVRDTTQLHANGPGDDGPDPARA